MPNKSSSSNDVSLNQHYFFSYLLTDWNDFYLYRIYLYVYTYSSHVYLANLHAITHIMYIVY
jgi:hypothetical protein